MRYKPDTPRLNRSHWTAEGLLLAAPANNAGVHVDVVRGLRLATPANIPTTVLGAGGFGVGALHNGSSSFRQTLTATEAAHLGNRAAATVVAFIDQTGTVNFDYWAGTFTSAASNGWGFNTAGDNAIRWLVDAPTLVTTTATATADVRIVIGRYASGVGIALDLLDRAGAITSSSTASDPGASLGNASGLVIGGLVDAGFQAIGSTFDLRVYDYRWSDVQVRTFLRRPELWWALYRPPPLVVFAEAGGGGATAALTGTITDTVDESDIVTGGKTLIITLTSDTWETFDDTIRQAIIDGCTSAQSEATGWNAEVRDKEAVGSAVRTSDTVCTITWSAAAAYDITAQETITVTVPASALVTSVDPVVATPTFTVDSVGAATYFGHRPMLLVGIGA